MLELVVNDNLQSSLACPSCGGVLVACAVAVSDGMAACRYCGTDFVPICARASTTPPVGLTVTEKGEDWSIEISTRSLRGALAFLGSGLGVLAIVRDLDHVGSVFGGHIEKTIVLGIAGASAAVALLCAASYWYWGRYSISVESSLGIVRRGVGRFGSRRIFDPSRINGVVLTKNVEEDETVKHVIRLEGVDFHTEIGGDLTEEQRSYIALFIAQRLGRPIPLS